MSSKAPDAFRTISEAAEELNLPQHVLRFWETKFSQIRPTKRSSGRRFYRPEDVDLLRAIRDMLYGQGYTIRGVQRLLKERGRAAATSPSRATEPEADDEPAIAADAERVFAEDIAAPASVYVRLVEDADVGASPAAPVRALSDDTVREALSDHVRKKLEAVRAELEGCVQLLAEARQGRL